MKLLFNNKTIWGWTMTGILGKNRTWFFGFSSLTRTLTPSELAEITTTETEK